MSPLNDIAFVLFKPISAGNVGSAARALKNMGFGDMRLVAPQSQDNRTARAMAVHGGDVLQNATTHPDLRSALADRTLVVGTTCRTGPYRRHISSLRDAAPALITETASNRIAIVFGPEDCGLTNEELKLCQRLVTIPTAPEYPSLNLAQAVIIVAYELMLAAGTAREIAHTMELAPSVAVDAMISRMEQALVSIGFLPADDHDHITFALRAVFGRSGLAPRELDILNGIASQIIWFAQDGYRVVEEKRRLGKRLR